MTSSVDPWREYRKRRNLAIFAFVGYTPFVFLIGILTMHLLHTKTPFYIVAISWMAFYAIASFRWLALSVLDVVSHFSLDGGRRQTISFSFDDAYTAVCLSTARCQISALTRTSSRNKGRALTDSWRNISITLKTPIGDTVCIPLDLAITVCKVEFRLLQLIGP